MNRRTRTKIYIDILRAIRKSNGKLKKTHVVHKANVTHARLEEYLDFLLSKGFVEEETTKNYIFYSITKKGLKFLSEVNKLRNISDAFGIPLY